MRIKVRKTALQKHVSARPVLETQSLATQAAQRTEIQEALQLAGLLFEKCEIKKAGETYERALSLARKAEELRYTMEALAGLLRVAGEALDRVKIKQLEEELDQLIESYPRHVPHYVWYCKGAIARHLEQHLRAQNHFHRYLRAMRDPDADPSDAHREDEQAIARAWAMLATTLLARGHIRRTQWLLNELFRRYEAKNLRGVNGTLYLVSGLVAERHQDFEGALAWYQKAHVAFLAEHNWYYHLYVLRNYAKLARLQRQYKQANWYLDLLEKVAAGEEFGLLRREIRLERERLAEDSVDLLIDSRKGVVRTRENGSLSLRKQYVLLHILEELCRAHSRSESDSDRRGLSKAEIIEKVWKEKYRPEAHDNKLYYNINRLRRLIEPDVKQPKYLLNWKEGYRLSPTLKLHWINES